MSKFEQDKVAIDILRKLVAQVPQRTVFWFQLYQQAGNTLNAEAAANQVKRLNAKYYKKHAK